MIHLLDETHFDHLPRWQLLTSSQIFWDIFLCFLLLSMRLLLKHSIVYMFIMLFIYCLSTRMKKDRGFFFFFLFPSLVPWWHMVDTQDYKVHWRNTCLCIPWACVNFMFCISDCVKVKVTKHQRVQRRFELLLLLPPLLPTNFECLLHAS